MKNNLINLKKKIIAYSMFTTLGVSTLTACNNNLTLSNEMSENVEVTSMKKIDYNSLIKTYFLTINYNDVTNYYIVSSEFITKKSNHNKKIGEKIIDIKTNGTICNIYYEKPVYSISNNLDKRFKNCKIDLDNIESFNIESVDDYITKTNNIKDEYTINDLNKILYSYINDSTNKVKKKIK